MLDVLDHHRHLGHPGLVARRQVPHLVEQDVDHVVLLEALGHRVLQLVRALAHLGVEDLLLDAGVTSSPWRSARPGSPWSWRPRPARPSANSSRTRLWSAVRARWNPWTPSTPVPSGSCVAASCPPRPPTRSPSTSTPPPPRPCWSPLQRGPHQRRLRRHQRRRRAAGRGVPLGAGADVGQGPPAGRQDDQRPGRDAGHQERLQAGPQAPPLPDPRRRLLRVEEGLGGAKRKQPYYITRPDGEPFAFAGLWEVWRGPKDEDGNRTGDPLRSTTIITTTPTRRWRRSTTACR